MPDTQGKQLHATAINYSLCSSDKSIYSENIKVPNPKGKARTLKSCLGYGEREVSMYEKINLKITFDENVHRRCLSTPFL